MLNGRDFERGEDDASADRVIILSDGFWRTQLGADPGVIGRSLTLDGTPYAGRIENDDDTDAAVGDWIEIESLEVLELSRRWR